MVHSMKIIIIDYLETLNISTLLPTKIVVHKVILEYKYHMISCIIVLRKNYKPLKCISFPINV